MNRDELAIEIKDLRRDTPVILLTGVGEMMKVVGEHPVGIDLIVKKPITQGKLLAAVSQVID